HEGRRPRQQPHEHQRPAQELDARDEGRLDLRGRNAERAEELHEPRDVLQLAEAGADELEPDGDAHDESPERPEPVEATDPASHDVGAASHLPARSRVSLAARSWPMTNCSAARSGGGLAPKRPGPG